MTETLTLACYEQTNRKLARLKERVTRIAARSDLIPLVQIEAMRSCRQMIAQYRREFKPYEATHAE